MSAFRLAAAAFGLSACVSSGEAIAQAVSPDLIYTRVAPCRVFDTTKTKKIPANSAKSFLISGAGDYAAQGGTSSGCGVPASAQAVSINITALNGAAAGSLTASAYAKTASVATVRYAVSAPETVGGVVDLDRSKITLRTTNTVNAIGDVTGYYAPAMWASVNPEGGLVEGSRVVSTTRLRDGLYELYFDREIGRCMVNATATFDNLNVRASVGGFGSGGEASVSLFDRNGAPANGGFYIHVVC